MLSFRLDPSLRQHPKSPSSQLNQAWRYRVSTKSIQYKKVKERSGTFLSVVVPAKNEAESLVQLVKEITRALRPLCHAAGGIDDFEIIIVDDGSTDSTQSVLVNLALLYTELRWLVLADQVGQSAATLAGIHAARGDWIATLDGDLQNDPADLVRLWEALPGNDAVLGWRVKRQDIWTKRVISYWANRLRNMVLDQSIRDTGCSVRIFPRSVALNMPTFYGMHRFFGSLLLREGCRLVQVPVHHRPRSHGRSHYTLWNRSLQVLIDLVGVAWLIRRTVHYQVATTKDDTEMMNQVTLDNAKQTRLPLILAHQSLED
jgi:dolichol-phosphate mannosyltransferase